MTNLRQSIVSLALLCVLALTVGVGCSDVEKRSYQVQVKNTSLMPVTVWLTKDGGVYESSWKSPEMLAIESKNAGEPVAGMVVRPGKTASIGPKTGLFSPNSSAILRVYLGEHSISDLCSISQGSPDRKDYDLTPGYNGFNVEAQEGHTIIERERSMAMSMQGSRQGSPQDSRQGSSPAAPDAPKDR